MTKARILADYVAGGTTAAEFDVLDGLTATTSGLNKGAVGTATGGTITTPTIGGIAYKVHKFTTTANFVVSGGSLEVDALVIAGGGGGGSGGKDIGVNSSIGASGGGAGGVIYTKSFTLETGTYACTVGAAGAAALTGQGDGGNNNGGKGSDSSIGSLLVAKGGGGGGGAYAGSSYASQIDGGCGGGDAINTGRDEAGVASQPTQAGVSGFDGLGNNGGDSDNYSGSGGGGANAVGVVGGHQDSAAPGAGGAGFTEGTTYVTRHNSQGSVLISMDGSGDSYAGGGAGGDPSQGSAYIALGGLGGGGNGANESGTDATAGSTNTGSGGGAGGGDSSAGTRAAGGSGIILIRYRT